MQPQTAMEGRQGVPEREGFERPSRRMIIGRPVWDFAACDAKYSVPLLAWVIIFDTSENLKVTT